MPRWPALRRPADLLLRGSGLLALAALAARLLLSVHLARALPRLLDAPGDLTAFDPALAAQLRAIAPWSHQALLGGLLITLVAGAGLLLSFLASGSEDPPLVTQALGTIGLGAFPLLLVFALVEMFLPAPRNDVAAAMDTLFDRQVRAHLRASPMNRAQPLALPPDACCKGARSRWLRGGDILVVGGGDPLDPLDPASRLVVVITRRGREGGYIPGPGGKSYYLEARDRRGQTLQRSFKTRADEVALSVFEWPARRYLGTCAMHGTDSYVDEAGRYHEPVELYESEIARGLADVLAGGFCTRARPER